MMPEQSDGDQPAPNGSKRIRVSVPSYYKDVSNEVWEELERYLFDGFLTSTAHILGRTYVFKTLNHSEIRSLDFLKPTRVSPTEVRSSFRAAFISHSIFMVDGMNALFERPKHINRLIRIVSKMDASIQEKILVNLSAINERASRLYPLTEIFVHENRSRFKWLQLQAIPVHSPMSTGIPGTDELGMNYCQQAWTALHRMLDRREEIEKDWSNAKFIGSCFNGKGVRAVDEKDRSRATTERSEREDLKMKILYRYLNRNAGPEDEPEQEYDLPDGRKATVSKRFQAISPEELRDQLELALNGEKDYHDLVVEAKERQLRTRAQELEMHKRSVYSSQTHLPPGVQIAGGTAGGGSRILGGKGAADEYLARMEALKLVALEQARSPLSPDLNEASDRSGGENPNR